MKRRKWLYWQLGWTHNHQHTSTRTQALAHTYYTAQTVCLSSALQTQYRSTTQGRTKQLATTNSQTHIHMYLHKNINTQCLPSNMFSISFPKPLIFGLPCTLMINVQTFLKASSSHNFKRRPYRYLFCSVAPEVFVMVVTSPSSIMSSCWRSYTMALAFTVSMKWLRKCARTCLAAQTEKWRYLGWGLGWDIAIIKGAVNSQTISSDLSFIIAVTWPCPYIPVDPTCLAQHRTGAEKL